MKYSLIMTSKVKNICGCFPQSLLLSLVSKHNRRDLVYIQTYPFGICYSYPCKNLFLCNWVFISPWLIFIEQLLLCGHIKTFRILLTMLSYIPATFYMHIYTLLLSKQNRSIKTYHDFFFKLRYLMYENEFTTNYICP